MSLLTSGTDSRQVTLRIERNCSDLIYFVIIEGWRRLFDCVLARHEALLHAADIKVVGGSLTIHRQSDWKSTNA
jgi:hypothetical protein